MKIGILNKIAAEITAGSIEGTKNIPQIEANTVLTNILNTAYALAGIVAVGFIIYGGILYATSAGDPEKAKKATRALLYSIVGLIVVLLAAAITNFAIGAVASS